MALVLASSSPRRAEILTALGIPFVVDPADILEEIAPGESAEHAASRLAAEKAAAVAAHRPDSWILAADTLVLKEGRILGKPRDDADAATMLRFLAGFEHHVVTAVRLARGADPGREVIETTAVRIAPLSPLTAHIRGAFGGSVDWRPNEFPVQMQDIAGCRRTAERPVTAATCIA